MSGQHDVTAAAETFFKLNRLIWLVLDEAAAKSYSRASSFLLRNREELLGV